MIDHRDYCTITLTGVCNCQPPGTADFVYRYGRQPKDIDELNRWEAVKAQRSKAGTSRTVDTEPRVTWLGDNKLTHPPTCAVYRHEGNWAPYCDCAISRLQHVRPQTSPPMVDPADVPKEQVGWRTESRAPWWVWMLFGAGGTAAIAEIMRWVNGG